MPPRSSLSQVPFFASLGEEELRALGEACRVRTFKRGEVLFHEGDPGNALLILQSGQVKIVLITPEGEETILHIHGPGECLGELSLVDGEPRSATAVALDRVEALALYRDDFLALVGRRPAVALAVMAGLTGMVRRLSEQVHDIVSLDATGRIAKKLLELAREHGETTPAGVRITVRVTQQELAQMVGVTRASVNKQLGWFEERGILTADREGILIHKPDQLRKRIY